MNSEMVVRLLCIDDDAAEARLLQKRLGRMGYAVELAANGDEGIRRFREGAYDAIVTDLRMPVRDGLDVVRILSEGNELPPIIMVTGLGDESMAVEALKLGVDDYIVKDTECNYLDLLPTVIEQVLDKHRMKEERSELQRALHDSEAWFRSVFEGSLDAVFIADEQAHFVDVNRAAQQLTGYLREELLEMSIPDLHDEVDQQAYHNFFERIMAGEPLTTESRLRCKDGRHVETEFSNTCIQIGPHRYMHTVARDITARKKLEELMEAQRDLAVALNATNDIHKALRLCVEYALAVSLLDAAAVHISDPESRNLRLAYHQYLPDSLTQVIRVFSRDSREAQAVYTGQARYVKPEVLSFRAEAEAVGMRSMVILPIRHHGRVVACLSLASMKLDTIPLETRHALETVTLNIGQALARINATAALRESEQKYRQLIETMQDGVCLLEKGVITFVNSSFCRILNCRRDEALQRSVMDFLDEENRAVIRAQIEHRKQGVAGSYELTWKTLQGQTVHTLISAAPLQDAQEHYRGSLMVMSDITARKHMEELAEQQRQQLIQADKMVALGTLVSGVAHEVNNPNNNIMLNSTILLESWDSIRPIIDDYYMEHGDLEVGGLSYDEMRENIPQLFAGIYDGAQRIKRIVADLKNFARQDVADLSEDVNIDEVIRSAISLTKHQIKGSTHHFEYRKPTCKYIVQGNFQRLEQVLINLIQNACQALTDVEQSITIKVLYDEGEAKLGIEVTDQGRGISPEVIDRIMDPFYTTRRDEGGTGLGLSVSTGIINEHRGRLQFESSEDQGTRATIWLPISETVPTSDRSKHDEN